jgi:hypothetical protein
LPHQDAAAHKTEPSIRIERGRGSLERARPPPGIVVAERHVRRVQPRDAGVAAGRTGIDVEPYEFDIGKARMDELRGAVSRRIVDDDQTRTLGQCAHVREGRRQIEYAIVREHDDADGAHAAVRAQ